MTIIRQKSAAEQRKQGWLILAAAAALVIAQATGLLNWIIFS